MGTTGTGAAMTWMVGVSEGATGVGAGVGSSGCPAARGDTRRVRSRREERMVCMVVDEVEGDGLLSLLTGLPAHSARTAKIFD